MPLFSNGVDSNGISPATNGLPTVVPDKNWARLRQPYIDSDGVACVAINDIDDRFTRNDSHGGEPKPLITAYAINDLRNRGYTLPPVCNAATLRKEEWIKVQDAVVMVHRQRLQAADDLEGISRFGGFDGMGTMTLEYQAMSDAGEAVVDMDGHTDGRTDTPLFNLRSLPLPITHSDFGFSSREVAVSRNKGTGVDVRMGEMASRRVAEMVEDTVLGNVTGVTYGTQTAGPGTHTGTSTVYGYRNFPSRLTKTNFTTPTTTNGPTTYAEVLVALQQLYAQNVYGPFILYHSVDWSAYMDMPFSLSGGNNPSETLRTMLKKIPDIQDIRRLDRLTSTYTFLFVQATGESAQMVVGMDTTTVQWEQKGGLDLRWKVPRFFIDYNTQVGILHGTIS